MKTIVGPVVVFGSVIGGFVIAGGHIGSLLQVAEFVVICGAAAGALVAGNSTSVLKALAKDLLSLKGADPFGRSAMADLSKMLYSLAVVARRDGLLSLERHAENPKNSDVLGACRSVINQPHVLAFTVDFLRMIIDGAATDRLEDMMYAELDALSAERSRAVTALQRLGDAMPGFGIVAAVLGVVVTMGAASEDTSRVGEHIAAALVGTFLGVLLAYGVFQPLASAIEERHNNEKAHLEALRAGLSAIARGDTPILVLEAARRGLEPSVRPDLPGPEGAAEGAHS